MTTLPSSVGLDVASRVRGASVGTARAREFLALILADLLAVAVGLVVAADPAILAGFGVAIGYWGLRGAYARRFSLSVLDDLGILATGAVWAAVTGFLLHLPAGDVVWPVAAFVSTAVVTRTVAYHRITGMRASGRTTRPVVIIGAGLSGVTLAHRIVDHPESGLATVGFLDDVQPEGTLPMPLLGKPAQLASVVADYGITDVIVAYGKIPTAELISVLRTCHQLSVRIYVVPRMYEMHRIEGETDHIWGLPLVPVRQSITRTGPRLVKRAIDIVLSGLALLLLAPVMAAVALAVRLDLGRGVFFKQVRVGLDGHPFTVHKFRSMTTLPEGVESPWAVDDDRRFGRVGKFIRRFSLDEIPQLWNVFVGEMSLVGPRPERPQFVDQFCLAFPRYGDRHRVPVGLTGLAAVEGLRGNTSIEDRAYFDNLYIENWSLWLDVKIMLRTLLAVVHGTGE